MKRLLVCLLLVACGAPTAERPLLAQAAPGYDPYLDALEEDWMARNPPTNSPGKPDAITGVVVFFLVVVLLIVLMGIFGGVSGYLRTSVKSTRGLGVRGFLNDIVKPITNYRLWSECRLREGQRGLSRLQLRGLTDADLPYLKRLRNRNFLYLELIDTQVTDAGLEHLKGIPSLKSLALSASLITKTGVQHLKGLSNLVMLNLKQLPITDVELEHLKELTNLEKLNLGWTEISDTGLVHLKALANLEALELNDTQVTDAGLVRLKGLTNLMHLDLRDTQVTSAGVAELQKALPNCKIKH